MGIVWVISAHIGSIIGNCGAGNAEEMLMMGILCDRNCLMKIERHHYGGDFYSGLYRSDARIVV